MRARFTAHALDDYAFLHRTYRPTAGLPFVPEGDNPTTEWTRLEIHGTGPGKSPDYAFVEFSAYGLEQGVGRQTIGSMHAARSGLSDREQA